MRPIWFRYGAPENGYRSIGIRFRAPGEIWLFSDRYTWRGFTLLGWRVSFVGWRRSDAL